MQLAAALPLILFSAFSPGIMYLVFPVVSDIKERLSHPNGKECSAAPGLCVVNSVIEFLEIIWDSIEPLAAASRGVPALPRGPVIDKVRSCTHGLQQPKCHYLATNTRI